MRRLPDGTKPHVTAFGIGGGGGIFALAAGLPAATLIGSTFAVALAATSRLPLAVHTRLRELAFAVPGISLGAGLEQESLGQIGVWSVSLTMLLVRLGRTLLVGVVLLQRVFGMERNTAILATSHGTMSNAIAFALHGQRDAATIFVLQMIRLLVLVTVVPPVAMLIDADSSLAPIAPMHLLLVAAALALGVWGGRAGIPAACLLFGMILSACAHVAGLARGPAPH